VVDERVEVDIAALVLEAVTDRDGARLLLVLADDDHVREPVVVTGADLATDRPVAVLDLDAEAGVLQFVFHAVGVAERLVGDGEDADLFGREPQREVAVEVLDEHHEEALVAPVQRAVDHHRLVVFVVLARVGQVEPVGHVEVELDGGAVPDATQRVLKAEVDLRAVEGAVAGLDVVLVAARFEHVAELLFRGLPDPSPPTDLSGRVASATSTSRSSVSTTSKIISMTDSIS